MEGTSSANIHEIAWLCLVHYIASYSALVITVGVTGFARNEIDIMTCIFTVAIYTIRDQLP